LPIAFDFHSPEAVTTLSTGFRLLDKVTGIGGLPCGRITELMGPEVLSNSGALLVAAAMAARVQRKQQMATIIDLSRTFDPYQAERCGLMAPHLLLTRPENVFEALTVLERVGYDEGLVVLVWGLTTDLLAHVSPDLLKTLLARLRSLVKKSNSAFLFVTSPAEANPFSSANYPAGFALMDAADLRLWIQAESWTHRDGLDTGYRASLAVIKNRWAVAGAGAELRISLTR
jgi:recombination protein RecA